MCEYTISIIFQGIQYQTNVIADRCATEQEVFQIALQQVQKQWGVERDYS